MLKIKLTIAYNGIPYNGWQNQTIGLGVQQKVEEALSKLFSGRVVVHGASRTDAGVHAVGMAAHIELDKERLKMPVGKLPLALNAHLPEDIRIIAARRVPPGFHARFSASGKQYRYQVWNHFAAHPLLLRQSWHVPGKLDFDRMREAASCLLGEHDFKSFAANRDYPYKDTIRTLTRCDIKRQGHLFTFFIEGDGFLYRMCRGIVGTLIQVGQGRFQPSQVAAMLAAKDRRLAGMSAPAHGLCLWRVFYRSKKKKERAGLTQVRQPANPPP